MTAPVVGSTDESIAAELRALVERSVVAHVATLDKAGRPVTWPMTPYLDAGGSALEVSTGVTYPAKAERARRDPRTCIVAGGDDEPLARITALATVHDRDLQANTDRFVRQALSKTPASWSRLPSPVIRAQAWHWVRVRITLTPIAIEWWPDGRMDGRPRTWSDPTTTAPPSDPPPTGTSPGGWQRQPGPWARRAAYAAANLGAPMLTVTTPSGFPRIVAASVRGLDDGGFALAVPDVADVGAGPACLTFDRVHGGDELLGQENATFTGTFEPDGGRFAVERLLPDFSLPARGIAKHWAFVSARRRLKRRLADECARRGQPVPGIHLP
ncbi:MAG: hypothetical protein QM733_22470 [Ilumatobacteraceae bacterium]